MTVPPSALSSGDSGGPPLDVRWVVIALAAGLVIYAVVVNPTLGAAIGVAAGVAGLLYKVMK